MITINQRIRLLYEALKNKGISLSKISDIPSSTLSTVMNKDTSPRFSIIEKIGRNVEGLNLKWLILNDGEMWLEDTPSKEVDNRLAEMDKIVNYLTRKITELELRDEQLNEKVEALKGNEQPPDS